jgi:hypothetical protein
VRSEEADFLPGRRFSFETSNSLFCPFSHATSAIFMLMFAIDEDQGTKKQIPKRNIINSRNVEKLIGLTVLVVSSSKISPSESFGCGSLVV